MAARKPLVIGDDGRSQQLQAGDTLNAPVSQVSLVSRTADAALVPGNIVYASAAGHVNKAQANASGTSRPLGFTTAAITSGAAGTVQTEGTLTLTTTQWDAVAGTTGGLTFNTAYFLDPANPGQITATVPTGTGQYLVPVGIAESTTDFAIKVRDPILL